MKSSETLDRNQGVAGDAVSMGDMPRRCRSGTPDTAGKRTGLSDRWARALVLRALAGLEKGQIILDEGVEVHQFGERNPVALSARIKVTDSAFYRAVALNGSIGAGESYMKNQWTTPDLLTLVRIMALNLETLDSVDTGKPWLSRLFNRLIHRRNSNSSEGSRRNIAAHYDLSNEFFSSFLDASMMYSAAIFAEDSQSLLDASRTKLSHICEQLQLQPTDHLLEIGSGWGGMAVHAAKHYGCQVTTTTLSQQQYEYTCRRVAEEKLQDRIQVLLKDYRELQGSYDKLVSIEMIEAVGHEYYASYFDKCSSLLKPEGLMLIQAITISDQRYEQARHCVDFIQRYIFPGGCLPSNSVIASHLAADTDMQLIGLRDITRDYALTLAHWRRNFLGNLPRIKALGFNEEFLRMWDFYLTYCQGGFMERIIHTAQLLMAKPGYRSTQPWPGLAATLPAVAGRESEGDN